MDQTATPTVPATTGNALDMITTMHFAFMAVLAVLVLVAIIYGVRLRGRRRQAERDEQARLAEFAARPPVAATPPRDAEVSGEARPSGFVERVPSNRSEDIAPAAPLAAAPERAAAAPVAAPAAPPPAASLTQIKGLGPKVQPRLADLGITRVDQIAALSDDEADALDRQLGPFAGRLTRDRWVEQARFLAAGDVKGFEAVFGRL